MFDVVHLENYMTDLQLDLIYKHVFTLNQQDCKEA